MKRIRHAVRLAIVVAVAPGVIASTAAAAEEVDCSEALEQVPRDGSTVDGDTVLLSYTGSTIYGGLGNVELEDVEFSGPGDPDLSEVDGEALTDARSLAAVQVEDLVEGEYRWRIGDGAEGRFVVESEDAESAPPTMGEGEVEAQMELIAYEEFPVLYREWTLRFPTGSSETMASENLRYLVEFSWGEAEEEAMTQRVMVTPPVEAVGDVIEVELGGETEHCRHAEPEVPPTEESEIAVYAVDLAGNLSEEPVRGVFEGVSAEALAEAYEEFRAVADRLEDDADDGPTTEEMAAELEAEEEEGNGCSSVGAGSGPVMAVIFVVLTSVGWVRRRR